MRIFLAIDLPQNIKDFIWKDFAYSKDVLDSLRFVEKESFHITLVFLGEISGENNLSEIKKSIESVSKNNTAFDLKITGYEIKLSQNSPSMIWLVFDKDSSIKINSLSNDLKKELTSKKIGFDGTYDNFGHVTLAKFRQSWKDDYAIKNHDDKTKIISDITKELPDAVFYNFRAEQITLFESLSGPNGREYKPLFVSLLNE